MSLCNQIKLNSAFLAIYNKLSMFRSIQSRFPFSLFILSQLFQFDPYLGYKLNYQYKLIQYIHTLI